MCPLSRPKTIYDKITRLARDLVETGDVVILVCPMDESAPKDGTSTLLGGVPGQAADACTSS